MSLRFLLLEQNNKNEILQEMAAAIQLPVYRASGTLVIRSIASLVNMATLCHTTESVEGEQLLLHTSVKVLFSSSHE